MCAQGSVFRGKRQAVPNLTVLDYATWCACGKWCSPKRRGCYVTAPMPNVSTRQSGEVCIASTRAQVVIALACYRLPVGASKRIATQYYHPSSGYRNAAEWQCEWLGPARTRHRHAQPCVIRPPVRSDVVPDCAGSNPPSTSRPPIPRRSPPCHTLHTGSCPVHSCPPGLSWHTRHQ
jgi:hypothetical protein